MTQISVYGADHSLFQSLLNFLNFSRGLYYTLYFDFKMLICCSTFLNLTHLLKETLNRQLRQIMIIQKGHDLLFTYRTDFVWNSVKVTVTTSLSTTCFVVLAFNFLSASSLFLTAKIVFSWSVFCSELIVQLSLIEVLIIHHES